jgi:hypothetical protein
MTALLVLRDKAIKPRLAAAQPLRPKRGAHNPKPIDLHYDAIQAAMKGVFHESGFAPKRLSYRNAAETNAQIVAQSQSDDTNVTISKSPLVSGAGLSWSDRLDRDGGS